MATKTKIKPLADRMIILADKEADKTESGLFIPDEAKEKTQMGKVVEVGSAVVDCAVGDRVLFGKYAGTDVVVDNVSYLILREEEVLCVVG